MTTCGGGWGRSQFWKMLAGTGPPMTLLDMWDSGDSQAFLYHGGQGSLIDRPGQQKGQEPPGEQAWAAICRGGTASGCPCPGAACSACCQVHFVLRLATIAKAQSKVREGLHPVCSRNRTRGSLMASSRLVVKTGHLLQDATPRTSSGAAALPWACAVSAPEPESLAREKRRFPQRGESNIACPSPAERHFKVQRGFFILTVGKRQDNILACK